MEDAYVKMWDKGESKDGPHASILKIRGTEILQYLSEIALEIEGPVGAAHDPADLHRTGSDIFSAPQRASLMGHHYLYGRCRSEERRGGKECVRKGRSRWLRYP